MVGVVKDALNTTGSGVILFGKALTHLPSLPRQFNRLMEQCVFMGNATVGLVAILSFFIGAVLALQTGWSFQALDVKQFIGSVVGLAMVRELGPVMTAVMVIGRIGSAVTAELASMKVYREVDALNTMNIPPERILVLPRLMAIFLVMPLLTTVSVVTGWMGGALISAQVNFIQLDPGIYFSVLKDFVTTDAVWDGIIKAQVFGVSVLMICMTIGLMTRGGPREIGQSVTKAVVASIIFVLFADYFVTRALL